MLMKNWKFWIALIVFSVAVAIYITWREGGLGGDFLIVVLPHILGIIFALVFIPIAVVAVSILVGKVIKRPVSNSFVLGITATVWLVLAWGSISVTSYEASSQSTDYGFSPPGCDYVVFFPEKPKLYSNDIESMNGKLIELQGAQLTIENGNAFLRAECSSYPKLHLPNKEQMYTYLKIISTRLGLQLPVFEYRVRTAGTEGIITGTKNSERGTLTIRVINYIGDTSNMTLYIGSKSTDFMTPEMQRFIGSIQPMRLDPID